MSADSWVGAGLLLVALVLLVVATAAETGAVFISRLRVKAFVTKGLPHAASLETYIQERHALLGTIAVARNAAVALALLETLPRLLVARSPERWGLRLVPVMTVFRFIFGAAARALDIAANAVLPPPKDGEPE